MNEIEKMRTYILNLTGFQFYNPEFTALAAEARAFVSSAEDPWINVLKQALSNETRIFSTEVWGILQIPEERRTQIDNSRLGKAMKVLGWERKKMRIGACNKWGYTKPKPPKAPPTVSLSVNQSRRLIVLNAVKQSGQNDEVVYSQCCLNTGRNLQPVLVTNILNMLLTDGSIAQVDETFCLTDKGRATLANVAMNDIFWNEYSFTQTASTPVARTRSGSRNSRVWEPPQPPDED